MIRCLLHDFFNLRTIPYDTACKHPNKVDCFDGLPFTVSIMRCPVGLVINVGRLVVSFAFIEIFQFIVWKIAASVVAEQTLGMAAADMLTVPL
jgi:hypothetical protein